MFCFVLFCTLLVSPISRKWISLQFGAWIKWGFFLAGAETISIKQFDIKWIKGPFHRKSDWWKPKYHFYWDGCRELPKRWIFVMFSTRTIHLKFNIAPEKLPPGARVRPPTNYWVSYQPTIGYLTNQLLGILPTNYCVSYQPTIGYLTNQLTTFLLSIFPPLGNPCF